MFHVKHFDPRGAPTPELRFRRADARGQIAAEQRSTGIGSGAGECERREWFT